MALTVIEPNLLVFAGNPIIVKATTDQTTEGTERSFLRIMCSVTFQAVDRYGMQFATELSQPVEDGGTAVFNLSDAAQTLVRRIHAELDMNDSAGSMFGHIGLHGYFTCREVWLFENEEIVGESYTGKRIHVVPGALTDYELLKRGDIDLTVIADPAIEMTRMPMDGRIVYKGEQLIIPTLCGQEGEISYSGTLTVSGDPEATGEGVLKGLSTDYQRVTFTSDTEGPFVFSSSLTGPVTGFYRINDSYVHRLRFINGFGALESVSVRSRDKLSYEVTGTNHLLVQQISTRPSDRRYATKSAPVGVYELSSGYVPKKWAEWYVQELIASPRVWMQVGEVWVPALIEAKDECVIYDRTSPGMPHVDFTIRLAIDGVTGCTW